MNGISKNNRRDSLKHLLRVLAMLACWIAAATAQQTSSKYSVDYSEQTFGASSGNSAAYHIDDSIIFAEPEKASQGSAKYLVVNPLGPVLQANNGIGAGFGSTMNLSWAKCTTAGVMGYNIYRSNAAGGQYQKINAGLVTNTSYADVNLPSGTYFYLVCTWNAQGQEDEWTSITATINSKAAAPTDEWLLYE